MICQIVLLDYYRTLIRLRILADMPENWCLVPCNMHTAVNVKEGF